MNTVRANEIAFKTFKWLKVNDTELKLPHIDKKPFSEKSDSQRLLDKSWGGFTKGVSSDVLKLYREYENLYRAYEAKENDNADFGIVRINMDEINDTLFDTHEVVAHKGSSLRLVLDYTTAGEIDSFRSSLIRVFAEDNSNIELYIIQREGEKSTSLESIAIDVKDNATVHVGQYELGSGRLYTSYHCELTGKGSSSTVDSIYFARDEEELNLHYNIIHRGKGSHSDIRVNGALRDKASKIFKSNLEFKEGAIESKGSEAEYAILMDNTVHAVSVPLMLCHEDDVEGNHAASAGKVDESVLFYIMSRGFSREEAEALIIESKFTGAIDRINDSELCEDIINTVRERIG